MIKKILVLAMLATALFSNSFDVNSNIGSFELKDQFDKQNTVNSDVQTIIFSAERGTSSAINDFLSTKDADFLQKNNAVFIADISGMPSIITSIFALPKMKKYNYKVLLIYDEEEKRFLKKEETLTVYKLENGVITSVNYVKEADVSSIF